MDHRITQCPRCGTSFRVTEAHLAVAAGAVRCGSCLHIFNAREHWAEETPPAPEPERPADEPNFDDIVIDDDALFDDNTPLFADDQPESPGDLYGSAAPATAAQAAAARNNVVTGNFPRYHQRPASADMDRSLSSDPPPYNAVDDDFEPIADDEPHEERITSSFSELDSWEQEIGSSFGRVEDLDEELSASDEEWTQNLLRDDEPLFADTPTAPDDAATLEDYGLADAGPGGARVEPVFGDEPLVDAAPVFDDSALAPDDAPAGYAGAAMDSEASVGSATDDTDPLFATPPRDEPEPDLNVEFLSIPAATAASIAPAASAAPPVAAEPAAAEPETVVTDASYTPELYAGRRLTAADDGDPLASLDRLGAEPLQIHQFRHEPRWPQVLWGLGLVAALALLGWQYVHANFDTLARGPARPWLAKACNAIGCALPPQSDVAQIRSGNLIVRSHPTQAGALQVDAIITNLAPFPQPYPQLQLQFTDLNGKPVAGRRFQASEYLAGELSGASLMPVQQPVHIALELVDPGPQAVNYALTVVAPTAP